MHTIFLPEEGLCLRDALFTYQSLLIQQAFERTGGHQPSAIRLLRTSARELERLRRVLAPPTPAPDQAPIDEGRLVISSEVIARLDQEGFTPQQIALKLRVNPFFIERVLRMMPAPVAKCRSKRDPERV